MPSGSAAALRTRQKACLTQIWRRCWRSEHSMLKSLPRRNRSRATRALVPKAAVLELEQAAKKA